MKKVYGSHDPLLIGQLREVLQASHIGCIARNDFLMGAAGELPPTECWPEIWVLDDADAERARALVDAFLSAGEAAVHPWRCPRCEEALEGAFSQCWRCGYERPPWEDASP